MRRDTQATSGVVATKRLFAIGVLTVAAGIGTASAQAAKTVSCSPVLNPYPNTRYADVDLRRIRATGVSCATARAVAKGAHRKALGLTPPPPSGIRHLTWNGWKVTGDLRGAHDTYVASRGSKRVRWVF